MRIRPLDNIRIIIANLTKRETPCPSDWPEVTHDELHTLGAVWGGGCTAPPAGNQPLTGGKPH